MRTLLRLAGALAIVLTARPALAQFAVPLRYNEGPGIKLGESLVFHPGIAIEGAFDSNPFYRDGSNAAGYLHLVPHLDLSTLPPQRRTDGDGAVAPQKVDFRFKTALGYREYLTSDATIQAQRALEVDSGLLLALFPQGVFSFELGDDFARTVTGLYAEVASSLGRDTNRVVARFRFAPGGGRLTFGLSYAFNFDIFEDANLGGANRLFHEIALNAKWKILPKTAVTLDVTEQIYDYYDPTGGVYGTNAALQNVSSKPLRIYAGLVGLITARLSTVLKLGYGNGFYDKGTSYNMLLALAELGYQFGPFAKMKLGFEHGFQDSIYGNYFTDERAYLGYDHLIAQRVILHLLGDYRYRNYSGLPAGVVSLKQNIVSLDVGADYQIKDWIYVGLGYNLQVQNRIAGPQDGVLGYAPSFVKHQVLARVGVSY
jgi:hypothetical protein